MTMTARLYLVIVVGNLDGVVGVVDGCQQGVCRLHRRLEPVVVVFYRLELGQTD